MSGPKKSLDTERLLQQKGRRGLQRRGSSGVEPGFFPLQCLVYFRRQRKSDGIQETEPTRAKHRSGRTCEEGDQGSGSGLKGTKR